MEQEAAVKHVVILYGSETGTAEGIARAVQRQIQADHGLCVQCVEMDRYAEVDISQPGIYIMVISNTGDGDPPENALKLWRWLLSLNEAGTYWKDHDVCILGLGDSSYEHFNRSAKLLMEMLLRHGAAMFLPLALADDSVELDHVVVPWKESLYATLRRALATKALPPTATSDDSRADVRMDEAERLIEALRASAESTDAGSADNAQPLACRLEDITASPLYELPLDLCMLSKVTSLTGLPKSHITSLTLEIVVSPTASVASDTQADDSGSLQLPAFVKRTGLVNATMQKARVLTRQDAEKKSLELEFSVADGVDFEPGDAFGFICPNNESHVEEMLRIYGSGELSFRRDTLVSIGVDAGKCDIYGCLP